jgi:hypothetical protein
MSDTERFMRGPEPRTLIQVDVASATVIEKGDFVLIFKDKAITPSQLGTVYTTVTKARREGAMLFAGIARNASPAGSTNKIQVDIGLEAIFKLTQRTAAAQSVADLFGICAVSNASNLWGLEDQKVQADCSYPIAVLIESKPATGTDVFCKLVPQKLFNPVHSYTICYGVNDKTFVNFSYAG